MTGLLRRNRAVTGIVAVLLLLLVALTLLNRDKAYPTDDLHPENPDPNGARAVARVLQDRGVDVAVAHDQGELLALSVGDDATLMVTSMADLGESTAQTLVSEAGSAGSVVLAQPPPGLLPGLEVSPDPVQGEYAAGCGDPLLEGLAIDVRSSLAYRAGSAPACFQESVYGLVVRTKQAYVVGAVDLFSNGRILKADNAAVALRLLGQRDRVVWYVPNAGDLHAGEGVGLTELLPRWAFPSAIVLSAAAVALVLWRGRRLGPVVVEPLPVVVRNSEAVESRGRLYRRSADRAHAAGALRGGALERISAHLALGPTTSPDLLIHEVTGITGRPAAEVAGILLPGPVRDDAALVALANALSTLETEVGST